MATKTTEPNTGPRARQQRHYWKNRDAVLAKQRVDIAARPASPSLDKIIPSLGYVPGNVRIISARANLLKNDATVDELRAILKDAEQIHESVGL